MPNSTLACDALHQTWMTVSVVPSASWWLWRLSFCFGHRKPVHRDLYCSFWLYRRNTRTHVVGFFAYSALFEKTRWLKWTRTQSRTLRFSLILLLAFHRRSSEYSREVTGLSRLWTWRRYYPSGTLLLSCLVFLSLANLLYTLVFTVSHLVFWYLSTVFLQKISHFASNFFAWQRVQLAWLVPNTGEWAWNMYLRCVSTVFNHLQLCSLHYYLASSRENNVTSLSSYPLFLPGDWNSESYDSFVARLCCVCSNHHRCHRLLLYPALLVELLCAYLCSYLISFLTVVSEGIHAAMSQWTMLLFLCKHSLLRSMLTDSRLLHRPQEEELPCIDCHRVNS